MREGFVSNSSSSSFIIAWKGDLTEELQKAFKLHSGYPVQLNHEEFVKILYINTENREGMTLQEIRDYYDSADYSILAEWLKDGYKVSTGALYDDTDNYYESFLRNAIIKWDSENLKIEKDD
jgi:hypothetical protein